MAMPEGEAGEPESGRGARTRAARSTMAEADLTTCSIAQARVDRKGRRITPRLVRSAGERGVLHAVSRRAADQHYRRRATTGTLFAENRSSVRLACPSSSGSQAAGSPVAPWPRRRAPPPPAGPCSPGAPCGSILRDRVREELPPAGVGRGPDPFGGVPPLRRHRRRRVGGVSPDGPAREPVTNRQSKRERGPSLRRSARRLRPDGEAGRPSARRRGPRAVGASVAPGPAQTRSRRAQRARPRSGRVGNFEYRDSGTRF